MRNIIVISILSIVFSSISSSATVNEKIAANMVKLMPLDKGWTFRSDGIIMVASIPKIRKLNPISLPVHSSEDEIWKEFSRVSDFNIVVKITTRLSSEEYKKLVGLRVSFLEARVRQRELELGEKIDGKYRFGIINEVNVMIPLPYCYSEYKSIWISTTDFGLLKTRPKEVGGFSTELKAYLAKEFTSYKKIAKGVPK